MLPPPPSLPNPPHSWHSCGCVCYSGFLFGGGAELVPLRSLLRGHPPATAIIRTGAAILIATNLHNRSLFLCPDVNVGDPDDRNSDRNPPACGLDPPTAGPRSLVGACCAIHRGMVITTDNPARSAEVCSTYGPPSTMKNTPLECHFCLYMFPYIFCCAEPQARPRFRAAIVPHPSVILQWY